MKKYPFRICFNTHNTTISNESLEESHAYLLTNKLASKEDQIKIDVSNDLTNVLKDYEGDVLKAIAIDTTRENRDEMKKS